MPTRQRVVPPTGDGVTMPGEERIFTTWLTSGDRLDHAVTDEEFTANTPEPEAVCGTVILLAPMEAPPGPHCVRCTTVLTARDSLRDMEQTNRALAHFHLCLGFLLVGDVSGANDYLKDVQGQDGRQMHPAVCDLISAHTHTPRLEP